MAKRQKLPKLHTRSTVSVPFPVKEGERVVQAAAVAGASVSGFIRAAALERADRVLGDSHSPTVAAKSA